MHTKLKKQIKKRKVKYVLHFTNIENLSNILKNGLIPREELENTDTNFEYNDNYRYDGYENSISCSIEQPNYKMFYKLRMNNKDSKWAVIILKKSILWKKDCSFFETNAASRKMRYKDAERREGNKAFKSLFGELDWSNPRDELNIPSSYPTDPQAEILVFDKIESKYITHIVLEDGLNVGNATKNKFPNITFQNHKPFFSPRKDYEFWTANNFVLWG